MEGSAIHPWTIISTANMLARRGGILMIMNSLSQGGGDRVATHLANGFAQSGIRTKIAFVRDARDGERPPQSKLDPKIAWSSAGAPMGVRLSKGSPTLGHRHLERLRGVRFIHRQIDEMQPAVVFACTDDVALVTALSRRSAGGGPLFVMKMTNPLFRPSAGKLGRAWRYRLFDFIFSRNDLVLTLSEEERRYCGQLYPGRSELFQMVVNPYVTDQMTAAQAVRPNSGAPRILAAARMTPQKRLDVLLRGFALLEDKSATLTILGDGPLRSALTELATTLGISDRIHMPGYVDDVVPWFRQAQLLVLSSDYEGLPAVVIEALACNVPVVTTDCFLAARALVGSCPPCAISPPGDARELSRAIEHSLRTPQSARFNLAEIARPYRVHESVSAHIQAIGRKVAKQR